MINRKKKIKIIQIILLGLSSIVIFLTYFNKKEPQEKIISILEKEKLQLNDNSSSDSDIFYNIKYSGIDLSGNRYILTSKEAIVNKNFQEIINMNFVNAVFYFKDNTILTIDSEKGEYNNKSLDMIFKKKVRAVYKDSKLYGEKIVYLNSKGVLEITDNVKVKDPKDTITADKLFFDLKKKTVDITSYKNKVNTNINLK